MSDTTHIIKEKIDVVDYIGRHVKLKKTGQNFAGICPFHREKTPSFFVNPIRQSWHCFGCDRGGDIFNFVMEIEGLDFVGALELLAKETNTKIAKQTPQQAKFHATRTRIYDLLSETASFYTASMNSTEAAHAREYLFGQRKITPEIATMFQIGFAPDSWDASGKHLISLGYTITELFKAGLVVEKKSSSGNRGWYDRFRNRLIFPISDNIGRVVGFSARSLSTNDQSAKYINSPETDVYKKSNLLYGLHLAKESIYKQDYVVIVEGQLDVASLSQIGVTNVVAPLGSAFTEKQAKQIGRLTKRVILFFDKDSAGLKATLKSLRLLIESGFEVKIAHPSTGKDPDEAAHIDPERTRADIKKANDFFTFLLQNAKSLTSDDDPHQKAKISSFILPFISIIPNAVTQETLTQRLAEQLQVSTKSLETELKKIRPQKPGRPPKVAIKKSDEKMTRSDALLNELTSMLLQLPPSLEEDAIVVDVIKPLADIRENTVTSSLAKKLISHMLTRGRIETKLLNAELSEEERARADLLSLKDLRQVTENDDQYIQSLEQIVHDIEVIRIKHQIKKIAASHDADSIKDLTTLTKRLKELQ